MRQLSVTEIARLTDKNWRTVQTRMEDAGLEPIAKKGKANLYASATALEAIDAPDQRAGNMTLQDRLVMRRIEMADLELAERRGKLLPADQVIALQVKRESAARARLLAIPSKLAGQFAPPGKLQQAEEALTQAIYEALAELAGDADDGNG